MGKFSGILLCSDFDSTLAYNAEIPQANVDAIRYFQKNGGLFTVISGRSAEFFDGYSDQIAPDRYLGSVNGNMIFDVEKREIVEDHLMSRSDILLDFILSNYKTWDNLKDVRIFGEIGRGEFAVLISDGDFEKKVIEAMSAPVYKVLFHGRRAFEESEIEWMHRSVGESFGIWRSWSSGAEIQDINYDKGTAARRIAELLGAKTLICAGDYENDVPLLRVADIAYAAKVHHPSLDPLAHRIGRSCDEGTIAGIIEDLDKEIK